MPFCRLSRSSLMATTRALIASLVFVWAPRFCNLMDSYALWCRVRLSGIVLRIGLFNELTDTGFAHVLNCFSEYKEKIRIFHDNSNSRDINSGSTSVSDPRTRCFFASNSISSIFRILTLFSLTTPKSILSKAFYGCCNLDDSDRIEMQRGLG